MHRSCMPGFLVVAIASTLPAWGGDWPQWRGVNRNGVAPQEPPLAEAWTNTGPKKVWESEPIPSREQGGFAGAAVVGDRVYVYVNWRYNVPVPAMLLSDGVVRNLGWIPECLPGDLAKTMEEARLSDERAKLKPEEVRPWVDAWIKDHLTDDPKKKFAAFVHGRLSKGKEAIALDVLDKLAMLRDKELPNLEEADKWFAAARIDGDLKKSLLEKMATTKPFSRDVILCLDNATGKTVWKVEYPGRVFGWASSSSPCVAGGRVYVAGGSDAYCFDAKTGQELWRTWLPGNEISSSFAIVDGTAIVLSGVLCGLDPATGRHLWSQDKIRGNNSSPVPWVKDGKNCVLVNAGAETFCAEAKTGEVLWKVAGGGNSTPVVQDDFMAVFSDRNENGLAGYRLSLAGAEKAWTVKMADRGASPLIFDKHVYASGGGKLLCVKIDDGQTKWERPSQGEIRSPILADGKIIALTGAGVQLIQATPEKYTELAKANLPYAESTSPSFANGRLYFRNNNGLACYDLTAAANPPPPPPAAPVAK